MCIQKSWNKYNQTVAEELLEDRIAGDFYFPFELSCIDPFFPLFIAYFWN
jgi:hypothetical protein